MEAKQGALAGARTARNTPDQNNIFQHPVSYPVPSVSGILMIPRRKLNQAKGIVMVYQRHGGESRRAVNNRHFTSVHHAHPPPSTTPFANATFDS
jgi:hypothetical protein